MVNKLKIIREKTIIKQRKIPLKLLSFDEFISLQQ